VTFDAFKLVQSFRREVTRPAVWTGDDGNILDYEQASPLAIASRHMPNACAALAANVTYKLIKLLSLIQHTR